MRKLPPFEVKREQEMKKLSILIVGMCFLFVSFVWALVRAKRDQSKPLRRLVSTYTVLVGASLVLPVLLCFASYVERFVSVNSYIYLFDAMTVSFVATAACGLFLGAKRLGWMTNVLCFLTGGVVTFMEFLGR